MSLNISIFNISTSLGPLYTEHQRQCRVNAAIMLVMLLSLKRMEWLQNGLQSSILERLYLFPLISIASIIVALTLL